VRRGLVRDWQVERTYVAPRHELDGPPTTVLKHPWAEARGDRGRTSGSRPDASTEPLIAAVTTRALREMAADSRDSFAGESSMSPNPFEVRCSRSFVSCASCFMFGTRRKSIFAFATAGFTVFVPCSMYPLTKPQIVQVGE